MTEAPGVGRQSPPTCSPVAAAVRGPSPPATPSSAWSESIAGASRIPLLLSVTVLAGAALRFSALGAQSFWYDEAITALLARGSLFDLASGRLRDLGNPPLLPILLHGWAAVFGAGDVSLRAFSAAAGVLSIPVLFSVGRRVAGERGGLLAAALLAVNPLQVCLGQEARVFALATLLALLTVATLQRALERPWSVAAWGAHACSAFALAYAHYYGFFLLLGEVAFVASLRRRGLLLRQAAALAAAALAYGSWLPAFFSQLRTSGNLVRSPESWWMHALATPMAQALGTTLAWKGAAAPPRLLLAAAGTLALLVPVVLGIRATRGHPAARLVCFWLAAPIALPLVLSLLSPIYQVRYAALATPAFLLLAAMGLLALRPLARASCLAVFALAASVSLSSWFGQTVKHDWRSAVAYVESRARPGDLLLFDADFAETAYAHYARGPQPRLRLVAPPGLTTAEILLGATAPGAPARDVTAQVRAAPRAWLIRSDVTAAEQQRLIRFFAAGWHPVTRARYVGIDVELLARDGP